MKSTVLSIACGAFLCLAPQHSKAQWTVAPQGFAWQTVNCMHFVGNTGYIGGETSSSAKTTNGGATWTPMTIPVTGAVSSVWFTDANTGFLTTSSSLIKTTNGGSSWTVKQTLNNLQFNDLEFVSPTTGFAVGGEGGACVLMKTTDSGETWNSVNVNNTYYWLEDVDFPTASVGYAVGNVGAVMKTIDGGNNWSLMTTNSSQYLKSVDFVDANTGFAAGYQGVLLKTTNGGTTWTETSLGTDVSIYALHFTDANTGYAVTAYPSSPEIGRIMKTTNGGTTWTTSYDGETGALMSMFFVTPTQAYAGGIIGNMVKMNGTTGVEDITADPISVSPNPSTGIFYVGGKGEKISCEVRDLAGNLVLVSDNHTVDLSSSAPGVYLLTVTDENGTACTRLVKD